MTKKKGEGFDFAHPMRKTRQQRRYSDKDRAGALAVLASNGGCLRKTAEDTGIPKTTLRQWSKGHGAQGAAPLLEDAKVDLAESFERVAREAVGLLDKGRLEKASARDIAIIAGVCVDKARLLRGEPTAITKSEEAFFDVSAIISKPGVAATLADLTGRIVPRALGDGRFPGDAGLVCQQPDLGAGSALGAGEPAIAGGGGRDD